MVPSAAFFDLDKTVIAKSSALAFGRPFYRDGLITRRDVVKSAYAQLMFRLGGADEQQMAKIRDHVAQLCQGWRVEQVSQIVNETLEELINPYVYAEAAALIGEHRAAGRDIVVVSTSGEELVRPIVAQLGITDVIATRMVVEDGRYTGEVSYYAAGPTKADAVRELAKARDYDLSASYAYSDSVSDIPLLETVGHPTAVNPDRALRRAASDRGWQVLEFRHPVPLTRRLRERPAVPVAAAAVGVGVGLAIGLAWYSRHRRARTLAAAALAARALTEPSRSAEGRKPPRSAEGGKPPRSAEGRKPPRSAEGRSKSSRTSQGLSKLAVPSPRRELSKRARPSMAGIG